MFKKGWRFDKDNLRPTFVLSNFSRIIEKALYHLLYGYLEDCKTLSTSVWLQPCTLLSQILNLFASPLIIMNLVVAYLLI